MKIRKTNLDDTTCKHILMLFIVIGMAVTVLCLVENLYYRDGIVIDVKDDIVTVKDFSGNEWDFIGTTYTINEPVKLLMNTEGTDEIYDDEVIQAFKTK